MRVCDGMVTRTIVCLHWSESEAQTKTTIAAVWEAAIVHLLTRACACDQGCCLHACCEESYAGMGSIWQEGAVAAHFQRPAWASRRFRNLPLEAAMWRERGTVAGSGLATLRGCARGKRGALPGSTDAGRHSIPGCEHATPALHWRHLRAQHVCASPHCSCCGLTVQYQSFLDLDWGRARWDFAPCEGAQTPRIPRESLRFWRSHCPETEQTLRPSFCSCRRQHESTFCEALLSILKMTQR